jgi:hypothetical protein
MVATVALAHTEYDSQNAHVFDIFDIFVEKGRSKKYGWGGKI